LRFQRIARLRERTFDHLHVIRDEAYIVLYFETGVSPIFEDKISGTCTDIISAIGKSEDDRLRTFLNDGRFDICFRSIDSDMSEATRTELSKSRLRVNRTDLKMTSRCARTPFSDSSTGVYVAARTSVSGLSERKKGDTNTQLIQPP